MVELGGDAVLADVVPTPVQALRPRDAVAGLVAMCGWRFGVRDGGLVFVRGR